MSVNKLVAVVGADVLTLDPKGPPQMRMQAWNAAVMTYSAVLNDLTARAEAAAKAEAEKAAEERQRQEDEANRDPA